MQLKMKDNIIVGIMETNVTPMGVSSVYDLKDVPRAIIIGSLAHAKVFRNKFLHLSLSTYYSPNSLLHILQFHRSHPTLLCATILVVTTIIDFHQTCSIRLL